MFVVIVLFFSLFYSLSLGQVTTTAVDRPTIGPIYQVVNNDSVLNVTFLYPINYRFDKLSINFTIYDFVNNNNQQPQTFMFSEQNFTDNNFSLPWVVPNIILQSGDYVLVCIQWLETTIDDILVSNTYNCSLTRTPSNSTMLPIANPFIKTNEITNTTIEISAFYPQELPYDQINITARSTDNHSPSTWNSSSNDTYSSMSTFAFNNLLPNTQYNICVQYDYSNSIIYRSNETIQQCQSIETLDNSMNKLSVNLFSMILFMLIVFI